MISKSDKYFWTPNKGLYCSKAIKACKNTFGYRLAHLTDCINRLGYSLRKNKYYRSNFHKKRYIKPTLEFMIWHVADVQGEGNG